MIPEARWAPEAGYHPEAGSHHVAEDPQTDGSKLSYGILLEGRRKPGGYDVGSIVGLPECMRRPRSNPNTSGMEQDGESGCGLKRRFDVLLA